MDLVPVRTVGHEEKDKMVIIHVPKFKSHVVQKLFPRTQIMFYRIKLDKHGSLTWLMINGNRNVQEIATSIRKSGSIDKQELIDLEIRLSKFFSVLYEQRYITFKQLL